MCDLSAFCFSIIIKDSLSCNILFMAMGRERSREIVRLSVPESFIVYTNVQDNKCKSRTDTIKVFSSSNVHTILVV